MNILCQRHEWHTARLWLYSLEFLGHWLGESPAVKVHSISNEANVSIGSILQKSPWKTGALGRESLWNMMELWASLVIFGPCDPDISKGGFLNLNICPATSPAPFSAIQLGISLGTKYTPVQNQKHVNQCATKIIPTPVLLIATTMVTHWRPAAAALSSISEFSFESLMSRMRRRTLRMRAERTTARFVSPKSKETKL